MNDQARLALGKMPLPLVAHTNGWAMLRIGAFTGVAGAACILSAVAFGAVLLDKQFTQAKPTMLLSLVVSMAIGFCFLGTTLCCVAEAMRRSPRLVIEPEKITDSRARVFIDWPSISVVKALYARTGIAALRFELKAPIASHRNPFLPGSANLFWRRKPNEHHISVVGLDVCPDTLAATVFDLVRQHGGRVEPRRPLL